MLIDCHIAEAIELAKSGFVPAGLTETVIFTSNMLWRETWIFLDNILTPDIRGLLMAIDTSDFPLFEKKLPTSGSIYWVVRKFIEEPKGKIILT